MTKRILAVDDEQEILLLYNTFLQFKGYEVTAVANAAECISYLQTSTPDVILLDVNMPGIDGLRLLEMIKAEPKACDLPIIMISARGDEQTVKEAGKLGCDNFIVKPFKLNELADRIASELFSNARLDIRSLFDNAIFIRTSIFREPGMNEFNSLHWDPYPMKYDDQDLCLMLPRGMRPTSLIRLPEAELATKIVVLYRHPLRWKRVWPKQTLRAG